MVINAVFSLSSSAILICLYQEKASIKDSIPCPAVLSTRTSMWGRGKSSFGLALFIGVFGLTEPALKLREKPFSKKRDHPVESRYPPVWLWGRAYFPLCYYGAGQQASECDPALHQPVCVSFAPYSSTPPPATFAPLPTIFIDSFFGS